MDKFTAIKIFIKVVEVHGFTAASKQLGMSRTAVSKYVSQLETDLGAQLLNRSTRFVSPTDSGAVFYDRMVSILADLDDAEKAISNLQGEARGSIRLNAPMSFGTLHLGPALADFMGLYPRLRIESTLSDRFVDTVGEGFDLTIRIADLLDSSLIAKKLCPAKRVLCASPDYILKNGTPKKPEDLKYHNCLHYGNLATGNTWVFAGVRGNYKIPINGVLCSNNAELLMASAVSGRGIASLPTFIASERLKNGRLVTVLGDFPIPEISIYALYPESKHLAVKIRLLIDFLKARFGRLPYWDRGL